LVAVTGLPQAIGGIVTGDMTVTSSSDHATLSWITLDDTPLNQSRQSLLVLTSRIQNTGMVWDGTTTIHNNWGVVPTVLAPLATVLHLHMCADSIIVSPLDELGLPRSSMRVNFPSDTNTFTVILDQSVDVTPWYGITAMGEGVPTTVEEVGELPRESVLEPNYPNPFNPVTNIEYTIGVVSRQSSVISGQRPVASMVRLAVYDLLGREVTLLVDERKVAGRYEVKWDASRCAAGVYFCRLSVGGSVESRKMVLLR
jgi:hypothetical protein